MIIGYNAGQAIHQGRLLMPLSRWFSMVLVVLLIAVAGNASRAAEQAKAVFAGGCFWSMELACEKVEGVLVS